MEFPERFNIQVGQDEAQRRFVNRVYNELIQGLLYRLRDSDKSHAIEVRIISELAKIVTGRPNNDLSQNRELFVSTVKASDAYKTLLNDYIDYANKFRHAASEGKPKPDISEREAESFVYMTGIFIRLAIP